MHYIPLFFFFQASFSNKWFCRSPRVILSAQCARISIKSAAKGKRRGKGRIRYRIVRCTSTKVASSGFPGKSTHAFAYESSGEKNTKVWSVTPIANAVRCYNKICLHLSSHGIEKSFNFCSLTQRDYLPHENPEAPHVRLWREDAEVEGLWGHPADREGALQKEKIEGEIFELNSLSLIRMERLDFVVKQNVKKAY